MQPPEQGGPPKLRHKRLACEIQEGEGTPLEAEVGEPRAPPEGISPAQLWIADDGTAPKPGKQVKYVTTKSLCWNGCGGAFICLGGQAHPCADSKPRLHGA